MAAVPAAPNTIPAPISEEVWNEAGGLPCALSIDLALKKFTVRDLLTLEPGTVLESKYINGVDLPVVVNRGIIGFAEFEVVGQRLAVRLTALS